MKIIQTFMWTALALVWCGLVYANFGSGNYGEPGPIKNVKGSALNWTDIRVFGTIHGGNHSGINWQSFGV